MGSLHSANSHAARQTLPVAVLLVAACFALLIPYTAYWSSNDDVGMAMRAGGFGNVESASAALIHSNLVWGLLAQYMPAPPGMTGYGVVSYLLLAASLLALAYSLLVSRVPLAAAWLLLLLPAGSVLIYPQFTKTAGLAVVAGLGLLLVYTRAGKRSLLACAGLLILAGFWVRHLEALLVLAVALPLLPSELARERRAVLAGLFVAVIAAVTFLLDWQYYQSEAWQDFMALNPVRAAYTDFSATDLLMEQPALLAEHGYSRTDVLLIGNWFFVDPYIADPVRLQALLDDLPARSLGFDGMLEGLGAITDLVYLLPVLGGALLVLILKPMPRVALAWGVMFVAAAVLGYLGRPAPGRVLLPLYALLMLAPLMLAHWPWQRLTRAWMYALLLSLNALHLLVMWQPQAARAQERASLEQVASLMSEAETSVWAGVLFIDNLYRPFAADEFTGLKYSGIDLATLTPNSRASYLESRGQGFIDRLLSPAGARLLSRDLFVSLLAGYCAEHHGGQLLRLEQHYVFETRDLRTELNTLHCRTAD